MPDLRLSYTIRDDFNRANENPIGAPWAGANTGVWAQMALASNQIVGTATPPTSSGSYWTTENWDNDQAEVWATARGTISNNEDWRLGLMRDDGVAVRDGYTLHHGLVAGTNYWEIRRYDNGSPSTIAFSETVGFGLSEGQMVLFRRNGDNVEGFRSTDGGTNWSSILSASATEYTTDLYAMLGAGGNVMGWDNFGGGPGRHIPQIYRWIIIPPGLP